MHVIVNEGSSLQNFNYQLSNNFKPDPNTKLADLNEVKSNFRLRDGVYCCNAKAKKLLFSDFC